MVHGCRPYGLTNTLFVPGVEVRGDIGNRCLECSKWNEVTFLAYVRHSHELEVKRRYKARKAGKIVVSSVDSESTVNVTTVVSSASVSAPISVVSTCASVSSVFLNS